MKFTDKLNPIDAIILKYNGYTFSNHNNSRENTIFEMISLYSTFVNEYADHCKYGLSQSISWIELINAEETGTTELSASV